MNARVLFLCGTLMLGGCGHASAPSHAADAHHEEASAAPPFPDSGAAQGFGYSFAGQPVVTAHYAEAERAPQKAKEGGTGTRAPQDAPGPTPEPNEHPSIEPAASADPPADRARQPMLIYQARLGLAVFRVQEQLDTIEAMTKDRGGYLVARTQNEIRVRVPADRFQEAIDAIFKLGDVTYRQITTEDVTAEYTDLEIRLSNALSVRQRLQALLDKAEKVEEAIKVERELARLTDEIESMKGRLKLLRELATYSTIDVSFSERSTRIESRVELPFPWLQTLGLEHLLSL